MYVPGVCGGWKMAPDPLGLQLQTVRSSQVAAGNRDRVLGKSSKCS